MGRQARYEYVIYRGEEIICGGTRSECAEKLDVSKESITKISSDSYKKIVKDNWLYGEKVSIAEIEKELAL
ncbi:hypothetical protein BU065_01170 [Staphylococcus succinus]|uniref:hypothetical protein n=1 Tax=Staphylococcus succinus TaxID=61015 RepID=UPI000935E4E1|nr:hypothetical protein [Staphylococcus succinus]RIN37016.1 hypothetical protein BU065_01170 [Staphylococcus succinus]